MGLEEIGMTPRSNTNDSIRITTDVISVSTHLTKAVSFEPTTDSIRLTKNVISVSTQTTEAYISESITDDTLNPI